MTRSLLLAALLLGLSVPAAAQNASTLRVFIDCQFFCDEQFARQELNVIDIINERTQADVHVQGTSQRTASGGEEITLIFIGRRDFAAMTDTLSYNTASDATRNEEREAFLDHLILGLARYAAKAGLASQFELVPVKEETGGGPPPAQAASIEDDPWNYWVFRASIDGNMNGQSSTRSLRGSGSVTANRTTEEWKISLSAFTRKNENRFEVGDETITSTTSSSNFNTLVANSIGEHWAAGFVSSLSTSSFDNTNLEVEFGPAVEYDIFPYSVSTRRLFTLRYDARFSHREYDELTIFALDRETLLQHSLSVSLDLTQNWGSLDFRTSFRHLISNFDRSLTDSYNFNIFGSANFRIVRGLSFRMFGSYSLIRDQIDLPANAATKEEILLSSIQLPTGFSYFVNFGLTYRFGSIFNNVVNPRL